MVLWIYLTNLVWYLARILHKQREPTPKSSIKFNHLEHMELSRIFTDTVLYLVPSS